MSNHRLTLEVLGSRDVRVFNSAGQLWSGTHEGKPVADLGRPVAIGETWEAGQ